MRIPYQVSERKVRVGGRPAGAAHCQLPAVLWDHWPAVLWHGAGGMLPSSLKLLQTDTCASGSDEMTTGSRRSVTAACDVALQAACWDALAPPPCSSTRTLTLLVRTKCLLPDQ